MTTVQTTNGSTKLAVLLDVDGVRQKQLKLHVECGGAGDNAIRRCMSSKSSPHHQDCCATSHCIPITPSQIDMNRAKDLDLFANRCVQSHLSVISQVEVPLEFFPPLMWLLEFKADAISGGNAYVLDMQPLAFQSSPSLAWRGLSSWPGGSDSG